MACSCSPWAEGRGQGRKVCGPSDADPTSGHRRMHAGYHGQRGRWEVYIAHSDVGSRGFPAGRWQPMGSYNTKEKAKMVIEARLRGFCEANYGPGFAGRRR